MENVRGLSAVLSVSQKCQNTNTHPVTFARRTASGGNDEELHQSWRASLSSTWWVAQKWSSSCTITIYWWPCMLIVQPKCCVPFPPWMATASTPFSSRYSWIASTSAFFSANISTCHKKTDHFPTSSMFEFCISGICQYHMQRYWQAVVSSAGTRAGTPSWLPLWHIPLPEHTDTHAHTNWSWVHKVFTSVGF